MTQAVDGKGLLLTHEKEIYYFHCENLTTCYWVKKNYELKIARDDHIMLRVPASLVDGC